MHDHPIPPGRARAALDTLSGALAQWATRDDAEAQPDVRQAANRAMDAIDGLLAGLHEARRVLVAEVRASDDATDARVDAMLAMPLEERLAVREVQIRAGAR